MSIRARLFLMFLITVLLFAALGGYAVIIYRNGLNEITRLHQESETAINAAHRIRLGLLEERTHWKNVLLRGGEPTEYHHHLSTFFAGERATRQDIRELTEALADDPELAPIVANLQKAHEDLGRALRYALRVFNSSQNDPHRFADQVTAELETSPGTVIEHIVQLMEAHRDQRRDAVSSQLARRESLLILLLALVGGGSLVLFFYALDRNIGRPAEQAAFLANYDPLTGLPNRALFNEHLSHALKQAARNLSRVSLLFLDLDHFKAVNDALGHHTGDELLRQVAERLRTNLRESDTPARLSGDEFAVIIEHQGEADIARVAQTIIDFISRPYRIEGQEAHVSASIGITSYPDDAKDPAKLLKYADAAMYLAKRSGKNCFHFFTEQINQAAEQRLAMERLLRTATDNESFTLNYQPQVRLADGSVVGAEALLRFTHDDQVIPADVFVPALEEAGLIERVGLWVLNTACRDAANWRKRLGTELRVAINLSARQLRNTDIAEHVSQALRENDLPAHCLEVEITEHNLIQVEQTTDVLRELAALGVRVAIDDFGTGYSSLSYLKSFSVDTLKIDRSFIRDITRDSDDDAVTSAIIALAHKLDIEVVAEGVETVEQQAFLIQRDCQLVQGYLVSRPLPLDDFEQWCNLRLERQRQIGQTQMPS